jgi:hypothetical protein
MTEEVDRSKEVLDLILFEKVDLQVPDEGRAEFPGLLIGDAFHGKLSLLPQRHRDTETPRRRLK